VKTEFIFAAISGAYSPNKRRIGRVSCAVARNSEPVSRLSGVLARARIDRHFSCKTFRRKLLTVRKGGCKKRKKTKVEQNRIRIRKSGRITGGGLLEEKGAT
jgi:hypothetical protein